MADLNVNSIGDASGGNTATINSYTPTESNMAGRNRIINGDMQISQAAAGSSITPAASGTSSGNFAVDRFRIAYSQNSKLTAQQNRDSVAPPAGFKNYLGVEVTATATVGATDYFLVGQPIEGYNVSDFGWGTASAAPVTLSFWAYSNTTGTFGGAINNSAYDRAYPFTYTINAANTWEHKTVTLAGDTSGTWLATNGVGLYVWFSLGSGSTRSTTAGTLATGEFYSATGANSLLASTSNYLYITGVQLEAGSVATPFEHRQYGQELALCQRYYEVGSNASAGGYIGAAGVSLYSMTCYKATKRSTVTFTTTNCQSQASGGTVTNRTFGTSANDTQGFSPVLAGSDPVCYIAWQASAEL
jgi:hypothetical protein